MADDDTTGKAGGAATFTQADVDRIVRERLNREREKYADYDELKTRAGEADKSKSQLDKVLEKVSALEERATKAEASAMRADVAQAKGLSAAQARRLHGNTREELEADADELLSMFKPSDKGGEGGSDAGEAGSTTDRDATGSQGGDQGNSRGRPREALRSGVAVPTGGEQETDPMKLAAKVPRQ